MLTFSPSLPTYQCCCQILEYCLVGHGDRVVVVLGAGHLVFDRRADDRHVQQMVQSAESQSALRPDLLVVVVHVQQQGHHVRVQVIDKLGRAHADSLAQLAEQAERGRT